MTRVLIATLLYAAVAPAGAAETMRTEASRLRFDVPRTWTRVPAVGDTQAARYRVPSAPGDLAETEFVLFAARDGKADGADAQLEKWYARFTQPDGRPWKGAAAVAMRRIDDLTVTRLDLGGTYVGSGSGAIQAGVSGYRLLGAIAEGDGGPWVLEILGPKATVGNARADFDALLFSLELHR
jgi:hypothetical protein